MTSYTYETRRNPLTGRYERTGRREAPTYVKRSGGKGGYTLQSVAEGEQAPGSFNKNKESLGQQQAQVVSEKSKSLAEYEAAAQRSNARSMFNNLIEQQQNSRQQYFTPRYNEIDNTGTVQDAATREIYDPLASSPEGTLYGKRGLPYTPIPKSKSFKERLTSPKEADTGFIAHLGRLSNKANPFDKDFQPREDTHMRQIGDFMGRTATLVETSNPNRIVAGRKEVSSALRFGQGLFTETSKNPEKTFSTVILGGTAGKAIGRVGSASLNWVGRRWGDKAFTISERTLQATGLGTLGLTAFGKNSYQLGGESPAILATGGGFMRGYNAGKPSLVIDSVSPLSGSKTNLKFEGDIVGGTASSKYNVKYTLYGRPKEKSFDAVSLISGHKDGNKYNVLLEQYGRVDIGKGIPFSSSWEGALTKKQLALTSNQGFFFSKTGKPQLFASDSVTDLYTAKSRFATMNNEGDLMSSGSSQNLYEMIGFKRRYAGVKKTPIYRIPLNNQYDPIGAAKNVGFKAVLESLKPRKATYYEGISGTITLEGGAYRKADIDAGMRLLSRSSERPKKPGLVTNKRGSLDVGRPAEQELIQVPKPGRTFTRNIDPTGLPITFNFGSKPVFGFVGVGLNRAGKTIIDSGQDIFTIPKTSTWSQYKPRTNPREEIIPSQKPIYDIAVGRIPRTTTTEKFKTPPIRNVIGYPTINPKGEIPFPPVIIPLPGGGIISKSQSRGGGRQKKFYTPSLAGVEMQRFTRKRQKAEGYSGLEIRPIVGHKRARFY